MFYLQSLNKVCLARPFSSTMFSEACKLFLYYMPNKHVIDYVFVCADNMMLKV